MVFNSILNQNLQHYGTQEQQLIMCQISSLRKTGHEVKDVVVVIVMRLSITFFFDETINHLFLDCPYARMVYLEDYLLCYRFDAT